MRHAALTLCVALLVGVPSHARPAAAAEPKRPAADKPAKANRLAKETSPYLLLHAHNPVDWYPWGEEALEKAKREKKPIFLSVGYSSCYWCHVMERESFMDDEIAALLNKHFVCIKVDREERPDIDEVYMRALNVYLQLAGAGGGGGWPMSMFLTPDAKPLFGGTYFPPRDTDDHTGFFTIVTKVHEAWADDPDKWQESADQLAAYVKESLAQRPVLGLVKLDAKLLDEVQAALAEQYDEKYGGFGFVAAQPRRPKFPEPANLRFLLARAHGMDALGNMNDDAQKMLMGTVSAISRGGIRDHLGGGFHRYSTDRYWRVPHFEKMLYDNGQLAAVLAQAYELEPREDFKQAAAELLEFVAREMTDASGGFYAAIDAETDGHEGFYYVWQREELEKLLTEEEFSLAAAIYGFAGEPNFEGRYIPLLARPLAATAKGRKVSEADLQRQLAPIRAKLLTARQQRKRPLTDTKILSGWNGLMIRGYADAGRVWKNPDYLAAAIKAADFVSQKLRTADGRLLRSYAGGTAKLPGYLDDYAFFIDGLVALHQATGDRKWLAAAGQLMDQQIELFWDDRAGGFFFTSTEHEELIARSKIPTDGATPSGNSVSAANLIYLAGALDKPAYLDRAEKTISAVAGLMQDSPLVAPQMAAALSEYLEVRKAPKK